MLGQLVQSLTSMGERQTSGRCGEGEYELTPQICPGTGRYGMRRDASAINAEK
jgi:hypothetical protein